MLVVWLGEGIRPTRDADLLGFGAVDGDALVRIFREICAHAVEPDGIVFGVDSVQVAPIRVEDAYGGQRVNVVARLGQARLRVQVDIGIGDDVVPDPAWLEYPSLLDQPRPRLRAYRPETAIAEKVHAMVTLGSQNSRMRDFFDIQALAAHLAFDGDTLAGAKNAIFARRATPIPIDMPIALTLDFAHLEGKGLQWAGFLRRNRLAATPAALEEAIDGIAAFVGPVLRALAQGKSFSGVWRPGGLWE